MEETVVPTPEATPETKALNQAIDSQESENKDPADVAAAEAAKTAEEAPKKERTPEEREIQRLRRRVDTLTKRLYQGQNQPTPLQNEKKADTSETEQSDSEPLSLSRKELQELIEKRARELAPEVQQQESEIEHRRGVVKKLAKDWGQEKFDAYASDLDDAFGGLAVNGRPRPATDAIFEADNPRALIEYLADPENAVEAESLSRMSAVQAGRAITQLEQKLNNKPKPSKVPPPIEEVRGQGTTPKSLFDLSGDEFAKRRRKQIESRR